MKVLHMSGAGNDFMVIDARGQSLDFEKLSKDLCARTGADGFMAVDYADAGDFRLHFYNSDGSRGEMCGNGARCVCKFAYDSGIAGETMTVQTDAGLVYGRRLGENTYRVQLNNPSVLDLQRLGDTAYVELGQPGVPHSVTELPRLEFAQKQNLLPRFLAARKADCFPKGVNVNFFARLGENRVRVLTYERGVEDFTLACGTGSAAVAVVLWKKGLLPGGYLEAENEGGTLTVQVVGVDNRVQELFLEGTAETLEEIII